MREYDIALGAGRKLHAYDTGDLGSGERIVVLWNHGTPNIGLPPRPLLATSERLGIRWFSYDRPGDGGSTPQPGRDIASAARLAARVADAIGVERFAVMGHSGGGPHALACAALLGERVTAAVSAAGPAPYGAAGLDWFAGMTPSGVTSLRAALAGRTAKEAHEASGPDYDPQFIEADLAALKGEWSWFDQVVGPALAGGPDGLIDDDLAYVRPWGFDPEQVSQPVLLLHGGRDKVIPGAHGLWLAGRGPRAELRLYPDDGHISVLQAAPAALEWLCERAGGG